MPEDSSGDADRPAEYPADRSLAEIIDALCADGFDGAFDIDESTGAVTCGACCTASSPEDLTVVSAQRVEGASDPADMSSVLAVRCPSCGVQGVLVSRYGPEASEGEAALLRAARGINRQD